ncbi:hypothetical protein IFM89_036086 [Coptis chinensis]|uniref:CCDC22 coiled-coil domain-containing protein n=1 Tax=Coptis chinensis TaxID=261450 RepID=A0A835HZ41_9MAGN|nr:hypothetical protein IFM89_036086 [Coptis chinensis]
MRFLKHWICPPIGFRLIQMSKEIKDLPSRGEMLKQELAAFRKPPLGEKERSTKELHHLLNPELQSNLQTLSEVELETEAITLEIRKREEEHSKLFGELEKQPRAGTRKSYIQRVTEITKNSRKQDADIEQILKDTRDLRLESNSIQERLHRTYVVADETMSRYDDNLDSWTVLICGTYYDLQVYFPWERCVLVCCTTKPHVQAAIVFLVPREKLTDEQLNIAGI